MEIRRVMLPIATDEFDKTVAFYKKITGKEVDITAEHDGYKLSAIDNFVVLGAVSSPKALDIPSLVHAIFIVDDLQPFWEILSKVAKNIIIPINRVSTGIRFIVEQPDGKIIEYLQLNE